MAIGRGKKKESGIYGNDAFDYGLKLPVYVPLFIVC